MSEQNESDKMDAVLREAAAFADESDWPRAYRLLRDEEATYPESATLLCMLGVAARELGSDGEASDHLRRALALQPTDPLLLVSIGVGLAAVDDPAAEGALRLAALTAPELAVARHQYGAYLAREGMLAHALTELQAAAEMDAANAEIHADLAGALFLDHQAPEALAAWEIALAAAEDDAPLRGLYGLALLESGNMEEAAEQLHRASEEFAADGELQLVTALAAAAVGWDGAAWDALARAELVADALDPGLIAEVEEAVGAGPDDAAALLTEHLAPSLLRQRLLGTA